jgi:hypothetical protein
MSSAADTARYYARHGDRVRLAAKHRRRRNVAAAILEDARREDRKRGRDNDLDIHFVRDAISMACAYCGETSLRMTLDRIDNALGHLKANVVGACERCNIVRRDMPAAAWAVVAAGMKEARLRGLFGTWTGALHRRGPLPPLPLPASREPAPHGTLGGYFRCGPPRCEPCRRAMREWKRGRRKILGS